MGCALALGVDGVDVGVLFAIHQHRFFVRSFLSALITRRSGDGSSAR